MVDLRSGVWQTQGTCGRDVVWEHRRYLEMVRDLASRVLNEETHLPVRGDSDIDGLILKGLEKIGRVPFLTSFPRGGAAPNHKWRVAGHKAHKLERTWFLAQFLHNMTVKLIESGQELSNRGIYGSRCHCLTISFVTLSEVELDALASSLNSLEVLWRVSVRRCVVGSTGRPVN